MYKLICKVILALLVSSVSVAQQGNKPMPYTAPANMIQNDGSGICGLDNSLNHLRRDPQYKSGEAKMNREILNFQRGVNNDSTVVPVVFHIINQDPSTIPDQVITDALNELNDAFAKRGNYLAGNGVDTKIRFCLSQKDPDGGITTGITRTKSYFSTHLNPLIEDAKLKNLVQWDPARYINIWYVASMDYEGFADFSCGRWSRTAVGGYATMPPGGGALDGIVVTGFGNLLTHEMGHYLGLYHTFEGRNCVNNNCTTDGDRVCDTPPDRSIANSFSCTSPENSCNTDTLSNYSNGNFTADTTDPISNFMDYGNNACHNAFTQGQAVRMIAAINTQRSGLLQNQCDKPCSENIIAAFVRNNPHPVPGDSVSFANLSAGAANYQWLVDDIMVSTGTDFGYTFSATGKYKITLKAYNTISCYAMYSDFVIVNCGVTARFYTNKRIIASKIPIYPDSIIFTNTSENASSFKWMMGNDQGMAQQLVSTSKNLVYIFPSPANYSLQLIATNGGCTDTTNTFIIPVTDPTQDGIAYMTTVNCYQQTKVRVTLYVCNNGYAPIPANTLISFYDADPRQGNAKKLDLGFKLPDPIPGKCCGFLYTHIIDVKQPGLNTLYMVFNDSGNTMPLALPNTSLVENNYINNISVATNFRFKASIFPAQVVLEPGDTLQLVAQAGPGTITSYNWAPALNLSCIPCRSPYLVADSDRVKSMIATSQYGCVDTAYTVIKVPPSDDFTIEMNEVECAGRDSLYVNFTIRNLFKRGTIPKGLVLSFYDGDPFSATANLLLPAFTVPAFVNAKQITFSSFIKSVGTGKLYAVVNDSGTARPLILPNTPWPEKDFNNNVNVFNYTKFTITTVPVQAILEPGDTLQMAASASPGIVASYTWGSPKLLSCTVCRVTELIADSNRVKRVIAVNRYGCTDSAFVDIKVPPANDYTVDLNDVQCAARDSLFVNFTLHNSFKRGVIPKGITVAFYQGDPATATARLLAPAFSVPDTVFAKQFTFSAFIKGAGAGNIYAVVNDSGRIVPVQLPGNINLPEKDYINNGTAFLYEPEKVQLQPQDTTVFRKASFPLKINTTIYRPASTSWFNGNGYSLSCNQCAGPVVKIFDSSTVSMQTENKYGCLIKGTSVIKIFPPDMTVRINEATCYSNSTTLVKFEICMNNNYDSVIAGVPVSFYDAPPAGGGAKLLSPVFYTPRLQPGACYLYQHIIATPPTNRLYAVVNDKGTNTGAVPAKAFSETNYDNNTDNTGTSSFNVSIYPPDTAIARLGTVQLTPRVEGGVLSSYLWKQDPFLSCINCFAPVVTPRHTGEYIFIARNEYACTDTAYAIVRTFTSGLINIPSAFSPNHDGLNDIFYILAGAGVSLVKNFSVFNRWGQKIFETSNIPPNDPGFGWDGSHKGVEAAPGTYIYLVKIPGANGKDQVYKGTIVLLR
ncbi:MAG: gliding motility-associated C-terminal domain-containing protein [Ferruginibacter sp.]|nr:gliding motility-associated C-terminal domain-containing protein [Ferruginibacter sp.]